MNTEQLVREICADAGIEIGGHAAHDITVHNGDFYPRVIANGSLGLGESYMLGWWDCDDLFGFFARLLASHSIAGRKHVGWRTALMFLRARLVNVQTVAQSRELADTHYNLGNELFEKMLGPSMAYSCGYWSDAASLDDAQFAKYDLICRKLELKPGQRLLDIGCGWGGLAKYASEHYGVAVVGITISQEQAGYARNHCSGLPVDIQCCDYRKFDPKMAGGFDKIVSVGMIEHVGPHNYRRLFQCVVDALDPNGLFLLHTIGSTSSTDASDPWIARYIFPGGVLPSMTQLSGASENLLVLYDLQNIGVHYTPTLRAWHDNFQAYWRAKGDAPDRPLIWGSHRAFERMWRYYLLLCAADFAVGGSQVWQLVAARDHMPGGYTAAR